MTQNHQHAIDCPGGPFCVCGVTRAPSSIRPQPSTQPPPTVAKRLLPRPLAEVRPRLVKRPA